VVTYEFEALTAPELQRLVDRGTRTAVLPFGSIEQQGRHLPMGSDAIVADAVGRAVADRLDAVLVPTVRVGDAESHMHASGTLTLRSATLTEVAVDIGESLARHGFHVIALVSTHGGNRTALTVAAERLNQALDRAFACAPAGDVGANPGAHSGAWLTSVMLALRPELVELNAADPTLADELQAASPAIGVANLERFVSSIVEAIRAAAIVPEARRSE
jgi:creatinine amidohydrolase